MVSTLHFGVALRGLGIMFLVPSTTSAQMARTATFPLTSQGGSGVAGTATLTDLGNKLRAAFALSAIAASTALVSPALAARPLAHVVPGEVVSVTGTPNLWIADAEGTIHFVGDPRALTGQAVDWNNQVALPADAFPSGGIGAPWLSTALVKIGDAIFLPQFDGDAGAPTLRRIQLPSDLAQLGITADNYGQYVLDQQTWEQRYNLTLDRVTFDGDFALAPVPPAPASPEASSDNSANAGSDSGSSIDINTSDES